MATAKGDATSKADAAKAAAIAAAAADAKAKADAAQAAAEKKAATAQTAADNALTAALGAQAKADAADGKATTADGRYTVATRNPTAADAAGKPLEAVWEVRSGSNALRRYVLTAASTWTQVKIGQDFVGDKAINTAQIADVAVGTAQIANLAVTNAKIGNVSAAKIDAALGQFTTATVQALIAQSAFVEAMYANKIVVNGGTNILSDPDYSHGTTIWGGVTGGTGSGFSTDHVFPGGLQSAKMVQKKAGTSNMSLYAPTLKDTSGNGKRILAPVVPGQVFTATTEWYVTAALPTEGTTSSHGFDTRVYFYDTDGTLISNTSAGRVSLTGHPVGEWFTSGGTISVKAPATAAFAMLRPTLYFPATITPNAAVAYVGYNTLKLQASSVLIENGAITTPKLDAKAITGDKIKAGALDSFQITSPLIQSESTASRGIKWNGSTLIGYTSSGAEAFRLDGTQATITSGTIQTVTTANRGLKITSAGLRLYDDAGTQTVALNADGTVNVRGNFTSGSTTTYAQMASGGIKFYSGSKLRSAIFATGDIEFYDTSEQLKARISSSSGQIQTQTTSTRLQITPSSISSWAKVDDAWKVQGQIIFGGLSKWLSFRTFETTRIESDAQVYGSLGIGGDTCTYAANLYQYVSNSTSPIRRCTSLRAAKEDIRDLPAFLPERILRVPLRDWDDRGTRIRHEKARATLADPDATTEEKDRAAFQLREPIRRVPGVIAEEVLDAGLAEFCTFDENGQLNGVAYDRLTLLLIPLVRELRAEVKELRSRIQTLEGTR